LSADALHCHRAMAKAMIDRGGDYVLAVKDNQPALLADAKAVIAAARSKGAKRLATAELNHGQAEKRSAVLATVKDMGQEHDFTALKAVACITSKRGSDDIVSRYFLISQPYSRTQMLRIVRQPRTIENCLHWPLDVLLDEDLARNRKDNAAAKSRHPQALGPQCRPRTARHKDIPSWQAQTRRLGRHLPLRYAQSHAIALPGEGRMNVHGQTI
jgi:predicted transposase YbfD/YdcC